MNSQETLNIRRGLALAIVRSRREADAIIKVKAMKLRDPRLNSKRQKSHLIPMASSVTIRGCVFDACCL